MNVHGESEVTESVPHKEPCNFGQVGLYPETTYKGHTIVHGGAVYTHISAIVDNRIDVGQFHQPLCFEVEEELHRFHEALKLSLDSLNLLSLKFKSTNNYVEADVVSSQIALIMDPIFQTAIEEGIRSRGQRVEHAVAHTMFHLRHAFASMPGNHLCDRFDDVEDVCSRILSSLKSKKRKKEADLLRKLVKHARRSEPLGAIIAYSLAPSIASELTANGVLAVITCQGGPMSHTAVVCRAKGIPYVSGIPEEILTKAHTSDSVLVLPDKGAVTVHPTIQTLNESLAQKSHSFSFDDNTSLSFSSACSRSKNGGTLLKKNQEKREKDLPSAVPNGKSIEVFASIDGPEEVLESLENNLVGVGLYRTEYLVFQKRQIPTFDEQVEEYRKCILPLLNRPIVFRTFDFSSDKSEGQLNSRIPALKGEQKGVPIVLSHPHIVKKQLLAIMTAAHSCEGCDVRILFPMISSEEILLKYISLFNSSWELYIKRHASERVIAKPKIGAMIELPSAALHIPMFKGRVDFLSIGMNDLLQYSLALDRTGVPSTDNSHRACYGHIGFLYLMKHIIDQANREGFSFCLCGELISDPLFIPIFMGFGATSFSLPPRRAKEITPLVQHVSKNRSLQQFTLSILSSSSSQEVMEKARLYLRELQSRSSSLSG